ncbi:MAG: hypothetical protein HQL63_15945 [Magnetococcales bacterium]|nr:hypothetical protein [Magnetococcales bacterium]
MNVGRVVLAMIVCASQTIAERSFAETPASKPTQAERTAGQSRTLLEQTGKKKALDEQSTQMIKALDSVEERIQDLRVQMAKARQTESPDDWRLLLREHSETVREVLRQMQEHARDMTSQTDTATGSPKQGDRKNSDGATGGMDPYKVVMEKRMAMLLSLIEQMMIHIDAVMIGPGGQR